MVQKRDKKICYTTCFCGFSGFGSKKIAVFLQKSEKYVV